MLHILDVRRALLVYLDRVSSLRSSESLFVNFGPAREGCKPATSSLSYWVRSLIALAYEFKGLPCPGGIQGRSTRSMSPSVVELQGASMEEICRAATWASPCTFVSHYRIGQGVDISSVFGSRVLASMI